MNNIKILSQPFSVAFLLGVAALFVFSISVANEQPSVANEQPSVADEQTTKLALVTEQAAPIPDKKPSPIPMYDKGVATYYVKGEILGFGDTEFMVDTGSGYMTINEETLAKLKESGDATFVKEILCILANGSKEIMPVYSISSIALGKDCVLKDVEAAVFPGKTRHILGLSGLKKAGSFSFSFDPPQLILSRCS